MQRVGGGCNLFYRNDQHHLQTAVLAATAQATSGIGGTRGLWDERGFELGPGSITWARLSNELEFAHP
eukprot:10533985-Lingulodinium_polyedra.AAC.1